MRETGARHNLVLGQGAIFLVVGGLQFGMDAGLFIGLTWLGWTPMVANISSRLLAACMGFVLNGQITFRDSSGGRLGWQRFWRFSICWILLTIVSTISVAASAELGGLSLSWVVKPLVEILLALVSFLAMRTWVYT